MEFHEFGDKAIIIFLYKADTESYATYCIYLPFLSFYSSFPDIYTQRLLDILAFWHLENIFCIQCKSQLQKETKLAIFLKVFDTFRLKMLLLEQIYGSYAY